MESNEVGPVRVSAFTPAPTSESSHFAIETLRYRREHLVNGFVEGINGEDGVRARLARAEQSVIDLRKQLEEQLMAVNQIDEALELLAEVEW